MSVRDPSKSSGHLDIGIVVIPVIDDIDLFGALLDYHVRGANDNASIAFIAPDRYQPDKTPGAARVDLMTDGRMMTLKAFDPFTPPITNYITQMSSETGLSLPLNLTGIHALVSRLENFLHDLRCGPRQGNLQSSVDVTFRCLTTTSRLTPLTGYPTGRSYIFELSDFVSGASVQRTQYGITIRNGYTTPLYLSVFAFHYGALITR